MMPWWTGRGHPGQLDGNRQTASRSLPPLLHDMPHATHPGPGALCNRSQVSSLRLRLHGLGDVQVHLWF